MRTVQLCVCMVMLLATDLIAQTDSTIKQAAPTLDLHAGLGISLGIRVGLRFAPVQPLSVEISFGNEINNLAGIGPEVIVYNLMINWHLRRPQQIVFSIGGGYGESTTHSPTIHLNYVQATVAAGWYSTTSSGLFVYPRIGFYVLKYYGGVTDPLRIRYDAVIDISFGYAFF